LEDLGIDGRIISKWIFKNRDVRINLTDLAQNRDRWKERNVLVSLRETS
jgi:hypothetical protein